jgi:hypothetical protein
MHFISYPRTAAELAELLQLGMDEIVRLLRENRLRVNLRGFLGHFFKSKKNDADFVERANARLLAWFQARSDSGRGAAALVYHHTGVRALHGFTIERIPYLRKADRTVYKRERKDDFPKMRKAWLMRIAVANAAELEGAGISREDIDRMAATGKPPEGYQVHHRLPLDDGGTNAFDNLILMRDDVEHRAVHGYYNPGEQRIDQLKYGEQGEVALPLPPADTVVYPNEAMGYAAERVPNVEFLEIFN